MKKSVIIGLVSVLALAGCSSIDKAEQAPDGQEKIELSKNLSTYQVSLREHSPSRFMMPDDIFSVLVSIPKDSSFDGFRYSGSSDDDGSLSEEDKKTLLTNHYLNRNDNLEIIIDDVNYDESGSPTDAYISVSGKILSSIEMVMMGENDRIQLPVVTKFGTDGRFALPLASDKEITVMHFQDNANTYTLTIKKH
ncbi:lipoprotein (plasmid) [Vibrio parahaemolyticus]|uniref:lipoprotein n=1 Tax=Vibrio TaxID=662 RepID=UPI0005F188D0|nr:MULTISPECIES: lipoprotein [Vibrio]EGR2217236.1 hypothetical protein [Vibrio parahaemolyticus]MBE4204896.1 lipoprotein [Vibrio parahaemolyticus]RFD37984.1 hypothetical protein BS585_14215 [Vibrio parahaemolyticus]TBT51057.1 hypothetical protein D5E78_04535 [Vibrio parahaemolyticus]WMN81254.1 lipoprotein [Vibrio parahaemolyticus]